MAVQRDWQELGTPLSETTVRGTICDEFNFGGLGDRFNLPVLSGVVMMESLHQSKEKFPPATTNKRVPIP